MPRHEFVVSAENNYYLAWQAMLFHYACLKHMGHPPIIMVHKQDEPLLPLYERIRDTGGIVQTAPNYRCHQDVNYAPRNTAGSLKHVESDAEYLVLCDPDMFLLRPFPCDDLWLTDRQVSLYFVGYLHPDGDVYQPTLDDVCRRAGMAPERLRQPVVNGGVPHVVPKRWQKPLSETWLEFIEFFPTTEATADGSRTKDWLATMWSVVMAIHQLDLEPVMTRLCVTNCYGEQPLPGANGDGPSLLHYCYGGAGFDKRQFMSLRDAEELVWNVSAGDKTIAGAIRRELLEARRFYGLG